MTIQPLEKPFSVCKLPFDKAAACKKNFKYAFFSCTDGDCSLICPSDAVPEGVTERNDGWRALRVQPPVNMEMVGVLLDMSKIFAGVEVSVLPVGTYDTVYFLLRSDGYMKALQALTENGYKVEIAYL